MILVDTSVWIDFLRGRDTPFRHTLRALIEQEEDICLTGIVLTEILQGIKDENESNEVKEYLLAFPIYDPTGITTYIEAATIYKQCLKKGRTIRKTIDSLIAAIVMEHGLILFHNDSDFTSIAHCTGLKVLKAAGR